MSVSAPSLKNKRTNLLKGQKSFRKGFLKIYWLLLKMYRFKNSQPSHKSKLKKRGPPQIWVKKKVTLPPKLAALPPLNNDRSLSTFVHTKNALQDLWKISNEFYQGELTIMIFGLTFEDSVKTWQFVSSFNPFPSLPNNRRQKTVSYRKIHVVFNNKTTLQF